MNIFKGLFYSISLLASLAVNANQISIKNSVDSDGGVSMLWPIQDKEQKPLTANELAWTNLISEKKAVWRTQFDTLAIPFSETPILRDISIIIGNRGGRDGFTITKKHPTNIYFNVSVLARSYGDANSVQNEARISRIFAHEYTHLLQHQWLKRNPYPIKTPLQQALYQSYIEGLGHFRSISNKWRDEHGRITPHAENRLRELEKTFVNRLMALKTADKEQADGLLRGLASGPFHKKWGALTVALWLTKESQGDDKKLIKWVNLGPNGVYQLADKYLPNDLKVKLNNTKS